MYYQMSGTESFQGESVSILSLCGVDFRISRTSSMTCTALSRWNGEQPNEEDNEMIIQFTSWTNPYVYVQS